MSESSSGGDFYRELGELTDRLKKADAHAKEKILELGESVLYYVFYPTAGIDFDLQAEAQRAARARRAVSEEVLAFITRTGGRPDE